MQRGAGVRVIVFYKLAKASVVFVAGIALLVAPDRVTSDLHVLARMLHEHALGAWSVMLSENIMGFATRKHVLLVGVAALFDSTLSFVEGWALHKRYRWSRWLIVIATSTLVPFEIASLVHHFTIWRVLVLAVNAWIVFYLVRHRVAREEGADIEPLVR